MPSSSPTSSSSWRSAWPPTASSARCTAGSSTSTPCTGRCTHRTKISRKFLIYMPSASLSQTSPAAIMCWAPSTTCITRCWAGSKTTSAPPSPTAISPCTPPSLAGTASPSRCKSAPGRCTRPPSTAWPPTGSTSRGWPTTSWAARRSLSGCASCWRASRTPTPRNLSAP